MARILVVDDSRFQGMMLKSLLTGRGHEALLAENGQEALDQLAESPDAILCDLGMPILDGFQFLEAMVERETKVPTLVISADIQKSAKERCLELGAVGFLNKPVEECELMEQVEKMLCGEGQE